MIRSSYIFLPGYDCVTKPCGEDGCGTHPGSNHGQRCDVWCYVVTSDDQRFALTLLVDAGNFPRGPVRPPEGDAFHGHVIPEATADRRTLAACEHVAGGWCVAAGTSFIQAREFFRVYGAPTFEQPESFWAALEAKAKAWRESET